MSERDEPAPPGDHLAGPWLMWQYTVAIIMALAMILGVAMALMVTDDTQLWGYESPACLIQPDNPLPWMRDMRTRCTSEVRP